MVGLWRYICVARKVRATVSNQGDTMKQLIALIAATVALSAFAQAPAAKKEEKKAEAKPAATAPAAPATATPAKSEPAKKDAPKADAKTATPAAK